VSDGRAREAQVSGPGDGERFERANRVVTIKGDLPEISANEIDFDPTFAIEPHVHDDQVDSFYVLEGEVEFTLGDRAVRALPGTWVSVPPGVVHGFRNPGPGRARFLNVHTPDAGFTDLIRGTGR
jgi:quercetin dioxygenase-like cupin family protein